jgi:hypothetical protein
MSQPAAIVVTSRKRNSLPNEVKTASQSPCGVFWKAFRASSDAEKECIRYAG